MLIYEIPGRNKIEIENIVFDFNGTIAVDGKLIEGTKEAINELAKNCTIYILSADTYGNAEKECRSIDAAIKTFPHNNAGIHKKEIVERLDPEKTICIGNGYNDLPMFSVAKLSIAILEGEGVHGPLLAKADIVARNILEALEIIAKPNRIRATLRS